MLSHIRFLSLLNVLRALGAVLVALVFLHGSDPDNIPRTKQPPNFALSRYDYLEPGDTTAFLAVGLGLAAVAAVRFAHGCYTLVAVRRLRRGKPREGLFRPTLLVRSKQVGVALAILDLLDLTFFPVTTACGLYGLVIFRHPDTIDFYEERFLPVREGA